MGSHFYARILLQSVFDQRKNTWHLEEKEVGKSKVERKWRDLGNSPLAMIEGQIPKRILKSFKLFAFI